MFRLFRRNKSDQNRAKNIKDARREIAFIKNKWHPMNRLGLSVFIATEWREFINKFGGPKEYCQRSRQDQMKYFQKVLNKQKFWIDEIAKLRKNNIDGPLQDAINQKLAAKFVGYYMIILMENDHEWERELAPALDEFLDEGWQISFGGFPLEGDDRSLGPDFDPHHPPVRFQRV